MIELCPFVLKYSLKLVLKLNFQETLRSTDKIEKSRKISLFTSFDTKRTEEELLMNYNIKWFEVEVWRGRPPDGVPEYMKESLNDESPDKSAMSPNRERRSRAGHFSLLLSLFFSIQYFEEFAKFLELLIEARKNSDFD